MKRISIYILVPLLLLVQGCVREDTSDCQSGLLLRFKYTLNNEYSNLFGSQVNRITVYVFDEKGKYVDQFSDNGEPLTNDYLMRLPLAPGKYSMVGYGGDFTTYSIGQIESSSAINNVLQKGVTDINDLRVELNNISSQEGYLYPKRTPDDLYVGLVSDLVAAGDNQRVVEMELRKITKKIKVKITGGDLITRASAPLDVHIRALNGRYQFDHSIDPNHGVFIYTPINTLIGSNYMEVDLKMMRLMLGLSPMLVVRNSASSEVIYNENMIEQILSTQKYVSQDDFDRQDEFVFLINIESKDNHVVISVSINGWRVNSINADM